MIDNELPADVQALLARGRDHLGPDAQTIARLRSRIDAAAGTAPMGAAKALGVKLMVVVVTATVGAGIYRFVEPRAVGAAPVPPQIALVDSIEIETRSALASHEPAPPSEPARQQLVPIEVAPAIEPMTPAAPAEQPVEQGISLAREIELVDRASLGLRRRDLDAARATLQTYADETKGRGQLAQDAGAIEVEVLCRLRDSTAATQLAAFEQRWPSSAHRSHLRATCAHREENRQ
jgi:hypothetical protein